MPIGIEMPPRTNKRVAKTIDRLVLNGDSFADLYRRTKHWHGDYAVALAMVVDGLETAQKVLEGTPHDWTPPRKPITRGEDIEVGDKVKIREQARKRYHTAVREAELEVVESAPDVLGCKRPGSDLTYAVERRHVLAAE